MIAKSALFVVLALSGWCIFETSRGNVSHIDRIGLAGSFASLIGLVITGWLVYEARTIHLFYKRHLLLPNFVKQLKTNLKNARKFYESKESDRVKDSFRKCDVVIERMPKFADATLTKRIESTRTSIDTILKHSGSTVIRDAPDVFSTIDALADAATIFADENKWPT